MSMKIVAWLLSSFLVAATSLAHAQQPTKIHRIGYLHGSTPSAMVARNESFLQGLRELGYLEGKNFVIEWRYAEGMSDRLSALAADLVRAQVDVIVTAGASSTRAAKHATSTIPIVMTNESDPVGSGVIASLARPGGNITGLSTLAPEIVGKQLELLKAAVPGLSRVAVLATSSNPGYAQLRSEIERAAALLKVRLQHLDVLDGSQVEAAFRAARQERAGAIVVLPSPVLVTQRSRVANLVLTYRLPSMYTRSDYVDDGGLMAYSTSVADLDRRAATFVDKILKGAAPADLPVEQPLRFELVINLKTAKSIGLTIPTSLLLRADRVIR